MTLMYVISHPVSYAASCEELNPKEIKKKHSHLSGVEKEKAIISAMIKETGPEKAQAFVGSLATN